jgi:hypothetical protein
MSGLSSGPCTLRSSLFKDSIRLPKIAVDVMQDERQKPTFAEVGNVSF